MRNGLPEGQASRKRQIALRNIIENSRDRVLEEFKNADKAELQTASNIPGTRETPEEVICMLILQCFPSSIERLSLGCEYSDISYGILTVTSH